MNLWKSFKNWFNQMSVAEYVTDEEWNRIKQRNRENEYKQSLWDAEICPDCWEETGRNFELIMGVCLVCNFPDKYDHIDHVDFDEHTDHCDSSNERLEYIY
jgi:hypothetical protein